MTSPISGQLPFLYAAYNAADAQIEVSQSGANWSQRRVQSVIADVDHSGSQLRVGRALPNLVDLKYARHIFDRYRHRTIGRQSPKV